LGWLIVLFPDFTPWRSYSKYRHINRCSHPANYSRMFRRMYSYNNCSSSKYSST